MINRFYLACLSALTLMILAAGGAMMPTIAQAQVLDRMIQGAIGGAVIGGVTRGHHGVGKGAAIGAAAGAVVGAIEQEERRKAYREDVHPSAVHPRERRYGGDPLVADIQSSLTRLGYEPGPVDGAFGKRTSLAISEYQKENGLLVTGQPSEALLTHMNKSGS